MTTDQPTIVADADARADWLEQRRHGITATEVAKAATNRPADRRNIIIEKVSGESRDFDNRYYAWGREREPHIAEWISRKYGIEANRNLLAHPTNPVYLATPDGYTRQWDGSVQVAEVKTSKHDLNPGPNGIPVPGTTPTLTAALAQDVLGGTLSGGPFWSEVYYDQMQWQMFVTGAEKCLFVWETHDDAWPNPTPVGPPSAYWVARNEERIGLLVKVAERLLNDIEAARAGDLAWDQGDLPAAMVDPVHRLLTARAQEAAAKAVREAAWAEVQALMNESDEAEVVYENHEAKVSWSAKPVVIKDEYDLDTATPRQREAHEKRGAAVDRAAEKVSRAEAALKRATESWDKAKKNYEERSERWHVVETAPGARRLTVTGKKQGIER